MPLPPAVLVLQAFKLNEQLQAEPGKASDVVRSAWEMRLTAEAHRWVLRVGTFLIFYL
jgi:hypothetical protein